MQLSAKILAELLGGEIEGDPEVLVSKPSRIEEGGVGTISFLGNEKYEAYVYQTDASILLVSKDFTPRQAVQSTLIRVDNVYQAIAQLLEQFGQSNQTPAVIAESAFIDPLAQIGAEVSIGPTTMVEAGVKIGEHSRISAQVYIGQNAEIGKNCMLYPGVRILKDSILGDNCIIHANTVIGSDGFGFAPQADGSYRKVPHVGNVVIESDVEIGANCAIDRASIGSTIIRRGAKLDNLIHIAHNVEVGEHTVLAGQVGVAGSAKIGKQCRVGGQVGIAGHITVADQTQIQAQSGIASTVKTTGTSLFGSPAIGYKDFVRSFIVFKKLPELYRRLRQLEKAVTNKQQGT